VIAFKKKPKGTKCNDHCTVVLFAHSAKAVVRILRRKRGKENCGWAWR
jgi:hypothetical protein